MIIVLQIVGGFVLLLGGAEVMVRGAVGLAQRLGLSTMVIGMTVVAFGTSAPELLVSLNAAISGAPGLSVGNVVGSNIANVFLILGVAGLIRPIVSDSRILRQDAVVLLGGSVIFALVVLTGRIDVITGAVLLVVFAVFLWHTYRREMSDKTLSADMAQEVEEMGMLPGNLPASVLMVIAGLAALLIGSELLVRGGVAGAQAMGVSETVIGLTIIAFGTSLPELAASGVAAYRGHTDVALGNVVGSNLFNVLGVIGLVGVVRPLPIPQQVIEFDIWIMLAATVALMPFMAGRAESIGRGTAAAFCVAYAAYIAALAVGVRSFLPG